MKPSMNWDRCGKITKTGRCSIKTPVCRLNAASAIYQSAEWAGKPFSAHPGNAIGTEYGWPTAQQNYLSAVEQAAHSSVNLANGNVDSYPGFKRNYLSCSGNEMVAKVEVSTDHDVTLGTKAQAKVGDTVVMTVRTVNALNNTPFPLLPSPSLKAWGITERGW